MIIRTREVPRWNGVMLVGISRGVVGIGHSQRNRSVVFLKKNFRGRFFPESGCEGFFREKRRH